MRDVWELFAGRQSSRVPFNPARRIADGDLSLILESARWAPTAHNMQNFEVVVVDEPAILRRLGQIPTEVSETFVRENYAQLSFSEAELQRRRTGLLAATFPPSWSAPDASWEEIRTEGRGSLADRILGSPTLLVVVYDPRTRAPASEGDVLGMMSLGCVLENLWLAAQALEIEFQVMSVFGGGPVEGAVKDVLRIPAALRIAFAIRLGYPAAAAPRSLRVRREISDFAHRNAYGTR